MNRKTLEVYQAFLKKGWIDRSDDPMIWSYAEEADVIDELNEFQEVLRFEIMKTGSRAYLIPSQDNELFLKDNIDYRKDIKATNDVRIRDLYLLNYLAIYLIFEFFGGEGNDPQQREFISREAFLERFTEHCQQTEANLLEGENQQTDYSENFKALASSWLGKLEGEADSNKIDTKNGLLNKILLKFKTDELFTQDEDRIFPTRKMRDLMPFFLMKKRVTEIHAWMQKGAEHASD